MQKTAFLLGGALLLILAACDSALEEDPTSFVGPSNFYNNAEDARAAVNGAYLGMNYVVDWQYLQLIELPGPALHGSEQPAALDNPDGRLENWRWTASGANESKFETVYTEAYESISYANAVIDNVPGIENMDSELRERFVGEARFIRAVHYFNLVRLFGGVPLVRSKTEDLENLAQPRTPEDSIYAFIIDELEAASNTLPLKSEYSGSDAARASRGAAQMLLAKVYLRRGSLSAANGITGERELAQPGDYEAALGLIDEVIDSGEYRLPEDVQAQYRDMFVEEVAGEQNEEVLLAIQRDVALPQDGLVCQVATHDSPFNITGTTNFASELPFYNSFDDADLRKGVSFLIEYEKDGSGERVVYNQNDIDGDGYLQVTPTISKYYLQGGEEACVDDNDFILFRYADLLLMKAEAINRSNGGPTAEAYDAINQVRERAGIEPLSGLGYQGFREALYEERSKELFFEHQGWFDAQRFFDVATQTIRRHAELNDALNAELPGGGNYNFGPLDPQIDDPTDRLFPLPQLALDRNSELEQNPGY